MSKLKDIIWVGSSLKDLKTFPEAVLDEVGYALHQVQLGFKPIHAKPLTGLGSGILEIVSDFEKNTYRTVYAVKLGEHIYVLHCFQKKSTRGIATPKHEIDRIRQRWQEAKRLSESIGV